MQLAYVLGSVTATAKTESLLSRKLMLVQPHDANGGDVGSVEVAVDTVGAGPGDRVLIVRGSAARQPPESRSAATDLAIVAIVDSVDLSPQGSAGVDTTTRTRTRTRTRSE